MKSFAYYQSQYTKEEAIAYERIFQGICIYANPIVLENGLDEKQLEDIFQKITWDHPNIFYVKTIPFKISVANPETAGGHAVV